MKRYSVIACSLLVAILALSSASQAAAASNGEAALRAVVQTVADNWNRGDGEAVAAEFTAAGTLLTSRGDVVRGRDEIASHFNLLLNNWFKDTRLKMKVTDVRRLSPDIATVQSKGGILRPGEIEPAQANRNIVTFVVVRNGVSWRIVLLQDTPLPESRG